MSTDVRRPAMPPEGRIVGDRWMSDEAFDAAIPSEAPRDPEND